MPLTAAAFRNNYPFNIVIINKPILSESKSLKAGDYIFLVYNFSVCLTPIQLLRHGKSCATSTTASANKYIVTLFFCEMNA